MSNEHWTLAILGCLSATPAALVLLDLWSLRGIPDPKPGDIWRSRNSGEAIRINTVGLTHLGSLTWTYSIETAPGEFNCIPMSGYDRRQWRLMVRDEKRVLDPLAPKAPAA